MRTASQPSFESERRAPVRQTYAWGPRGPAETGTRQTGTRRVACLLCGFLIAFRRQAGVATHRPSMGDVYFTLCDCSARRCGVVQVFTYRSDGPGV